MDCIEKLKKMGLKEINAKTKIAYKRLEDIFECRFAELDKTRARGFINILQRECKVDMSEWLEKYSEYQRQEEERKMQEEVDNDDKESKDKLNIVFVDTTAKDKTYIVLFVLFLILAISFVIYFVYNNVIDKKEPALQTNQQNTQIEKQINQLKQIEELIPSSIDSVESDNSLDSMPQNNVVDSNATMPITDVNATIPLENISNISTIDETTSEVEENPNQDIEQPQSVPLINTNPINTNPQAGTFSVDEVTITPHSPLWVGVIDLQTYKKKQLSISNKWAIKLDNSAIIRTGHGYFDIQAPNNFNKQYIGGDNKYFLWTKENGFKEISKSEFLSFNRGEEW